MAELPNKIHEIEVQDSGLMGNFEMKHYTKVHKVTIVCLSVQEVSERERKISQMRESESAAAGGKAAKEGERAQWERQQEADRADEESRCGVVDWQGQVLTFLARSRKTKLSF